MVNDRNPRLWFLLSPLHAGLAILLWVSSSQAALLKDIRIGEYDEFTRIVFEFNIHTGIDAIEKVQPGVLKITFADVRTDFVRTIPLKYSERLNNFEVWQYKNQLSVVFRFNYKKLRFDNFQLKSPPRMVVDVYQGLLQPEASTAQQNQIVQEAPPHSGSVTPLTPEAERQDSPLPLDRLSLPFTGKSPGQAAPDSTDAEKPQTGGKRNELESIPVQPAVISQRAGQPQPQGSDVVAMAEAAPPISKKGLQYYLLVALVILTIAILSLLVIMLISRHKWTNGKKALKIEDLLHRQDQHIASINSQIEEHLKRYDEI